MDAAQPPTETRSVGREAAAIDTAPVSHAEAAAVEAAEGRAWHDLYAAAPAGFAATAGLDTREIAGARVIRWVASGRRYFSRVIGLAVSERATEGAIDAAIAWFEQHEITMFLLQSLPHCEPADYENWLRERGLEPFDQQDRIVRDARSLQPRSPADDRDLDVECVTVATAEEWSDFLQRVYRLDTGDWLPHLIGRRGWHQYVAREGGAIVGARGMYVDPTGYAWLGMDGPVPGLRTDDYEPDAAICEAIVRDGLRLGVRIFLADIEAASREMDTPAYTNFAQLGFTRPYVRTHWARIA